MPCWAPALTPSWRVSCTMNCAPAMPENDCPGFAALLFERCSTCLRLAEDRSRRGLTLPQISIVRVDGRWQCRSEIQRSIPTLTERVAS